LCPLTVSTPSITFYNWGRIGQSKLKNMAPVFENKMRIVDALCGAENYKEVEEPY